MNDNGQERPMANTTINEPLSAINPKVDLCFKYLLSDPKLRIALVNDILEASGLSLVQELTPVNGEIAREKMKERGATLDFYAKTLTGKTINIEMQGSEHGNFVQRIFLHFSKIHNTKFKRGDMYEHLEIGDTVIIAFTNFAVTNESDFLNPYGFLHLKHHRPLKQDVVHVIFVELTKLNKLSVQPLRAELWAAFFRNEKRFKESLEEYDMTKTACLKLEDLRKDHDLFSAYKEHLEWYNDEEFKMASTRYEAKKEGMLEGKIEGKIEGKNALQEIYRRAVKLKNSGASIDEIKNKLGDTEDTEMVLEILKDLRS